METSTARIEATVRHLSQTIGPRPPGSAAEAAAAEYVQRQFRQAGLQTWVERPHLPSHTAQRSKVRVAGVERGFPSQPSQFSTSAAVAGKLLYLGNTSMPRSQLAEVRGRIGLVARGDGSHTQVIDYLRQLGHAGLQGLIVISPYMDEILTKSIRYPEITAFPIAAVSYRTAARLRRLEGAWAELVVESGEQPRNSSPNVIGELPGTGPHWLTVSAHMDTAPGAPGATDNASGLALLLELARELAGQTLNARVQLVGTGSEEYGRTDMVGAGAQAYFTDREQQLEHAIAHVELDDVGNLLGTPAAYLDGSGPFQRAVAAALGTDWPCRGPASISCDHGAAVQRGIPYVWINDSQGFPRPFYHSPADTLEFFSAATTASAVPAVAALIRSLANHPPFYRFLREGDRLIRPMRITDLQAVRDITRAAFASVSMDHLREEYFGAELGARPWHEHKSAAMDRVFLAHGFYQSLVCETADGVVGYATYHIDPQRGLGEIGNNAVHPHHQRRGIGKALQREIVQRMRAEGIQRRIVSTRANDLAARHVYEGLGFQRLIDTIHYVGKLDVDDLDRGVPW